MPKAEWPDWGDMLLRFWQQPQNKSLQQCLDLLKEAISEEKCPSYSAAQRFIKNCRLKSEKREEWDNEK